MFRSLLHWLNRLGRRPGAVPQPPRRPAMRVEALEDRSLPSTVAGFVYHDLNNNGVMDAGEPGIANDTVELHSAVDNHVLATTVTDGQGHYQFTGDPTAPRVVGTVTTDAVFADAATNNTQTATINKFDPSLGTLTGVDITYNGDMTTHVRVESLDGAPSQVTAAVAGTEDVQLPGGLPPLEAALSYAPPTVSLAASDGTVDFGGASGHDFGQQQTTGQATLSLDASKQDLSAFVGSGTLQLSETARAASAVSGPGNLATQVNTEAGGAVHVVYHYTQEAPLQPGSYTVVEPHTPPNYLDGQNTSDNHTPLNTPVGDNVIPVTLTPGGDSLTNNFGKLQPSGITGNVYEDLNYNGQRDTGEAGIGGVTLTLTGTDYTGQQVSQTTSTLSDGTYVFVNLRPGTYAITETQPAGYGQGVDQVGDLGGTLSSQDVMTGIPVGQAVVGHHYDFGEVKPGSLSGKVYNDSNDNGQLDAGEAGIGAVTVNLTGVDNQGHAVNQSQQTGADGSYSFGGLLPGVYTLTKATQPAGYLDGATNAGSQGAVVGTDTLSQINVLSGTNGVNNNFGEVQPASVAGTVFVDHNNDGYIQAGDSGIASVQVSLSGTNDLNQQVSLTTWTAVDGTYSFGGLRPGSYTLTAQQPGGYTPGIDRPGNLGGTNPATNQLTVNLAPNAVGINYNFAQLLQSTPENPGGPPFGGPVAPAVIPSGGTPGSPSGGTPGTSVSPSAIPSTPDNGGPVQTPDVTEISKRLLISGLWKAWE